MGETLWPDGNQCCVGLSFDVDAEWVFMGNDPKVANQPRKLSLGSMNGDPMPSAGYWISWMNTGSRLPFLSRGSTRKIIPR